MTWHRVGDGRRRRRRSSRARCHDHEVVEEEAAPRASRPIGRSTAGARASRRSCPPAWRTRSHQGARCPRRRAAAPPRPEAPSADQPPSPRPTPRSRSSSPPRADEAHDLRRSVAVEVRGDRLDRRARPREHERPGSSGTAIDDGRRRRGQRDRRRRPARRASAASGHGVSIGRRAYRRLLASSAMPPPPSSGRRRRTRGPRPASAPTSTGSERERGLRFDDYDALLRWSIDDLDAFWSSVWDHFGVSSGDRARPGARRRRDAGRAMVPAARLNWAEHCLRLAGRRGDDGGDRALADPRADHADRRRAARRGRAGAGRPRAARRRPGDRVAAYLPNVPEAVVGPAGHGLARCDLVELRARVRRALRRRPLEPDRAEGAARRSTATATATARSTAPARWPPSGRRCRA